MADTTVTLDGPGVGGSTIDVDDIGGTVTPYSKLKFGPSGTATHVTASVGLPVDIKASTTLTETNSGTIAGDTTSIDGKITACDTGAVVVSSGTITTTKSSTDNNSISTNNSSTATLGISANFTGTGDDVSSCATVTVQIDASHDSAASGMTFEFSTDNTNWDDVYTFTYTAADGARRFQFPVTAQYFRVNYTNGGTGQSHFRLQTILHKNNTLTSIHRLGNNIDPDRSSQLTSSVILAQASGSGDFVPVQASAAGNFKIALEEFDGVPVGGGTEAGALRVTMASDSTGVMTVDGTGTFTVDGSGVTQPVSGTVTETNSTAILADTANMDTNLGTLAGAVAAGQMQVDIVADGAGLLTTSAHDAAFGTAGTADAQVRSVQGIASMTPLLVDATGQGDVPITLGGEAVVLGAGSAAIGKLVANSGVDIGDVDVLSLPNVTLAAGTNTNEIVGDVAHDAAVGGNPVLVGLESRTTAPTAVGDGDAVRAQATSLGKQVVQPYAIPASTWSYASSAAVTDTADDAAKAAAGAGIRNYITGVQVMNGHDTVGTAVVIKDGSTVIWQGWAEQTGGGCSAAFNPPLRGTANTAVNVANITTGSSTFFNLQGYEATE